MQRLTDRLDVELDAETEAICAEVCEALEWYDPAVPGSTEMARALGVTWNWFVALSRAPDHLCRQRIVQAVEALVRSDRSLFIADTGYIFVRDQVRADGGKPEFEPADPETGEVGREVITWPTGRTAGGGWSYERKDAA